MIEWQDIRPILMLLVQIVVPMLLVGGIGFATYCWRQRKKKQAATNRGMPGSPVAPRDSDDPKSELQKRLKAHKDKKLREPAG